MRAVCVPQPWASLLTLGRTVKPSIQLPFRPALDAPTVIYADAWDGDRDNAYRLARAANALLAKHRCPLQIPLPMPVHTLLATCTLINGRPTTQSRPYHDLDRQLGDWFDSETWTYTVARLQPLKAAYPFTYKGDREIAWVVPAEVSQAIFRRTAG